MTLWTGWLGPENCHKLDDVTETEWEYFNTLVRLIYKRYNLQLVNHKNHSIEKIENIETTLATYEESMNKDASKFTNYFLPELDCIISEEWDYTYIIWHKNNGAVEALEPFIKKAKLYNFHN